MSTSNKTPNSATAKTAWAPKAFFAAATGMLVAASGLVVIGFTALGSGGNPPSRAVLRAQSHTYALDVVATQAAQAKGLGGRGSLPADAGMLFWFTDDATRCFWMKDMRFSLDIIWLDSQRRVVHLEENVSPRTYPHSYCPSAAARYVIELPAGQAKAAGIRQGQTLTF